MSEPFLLLKWLHILSAALLFGTGLGTAFQMWFAHRRREPRAIAVVAGNVVLADWIFTATSGLIQPLTGLALAVLAGYDLRASRLVASLGLYAIAAACWFVVVALQLRIRVMTEAAVAAGTPLPAIYERLMRLWFALGWPAFLSLIAVFWLMVAKPVLW